ncbi:hypothetical protein SCAR479_09140 [Seiridium cardinale]|uniref:Methyltransferase type 11 domain-containing protein n=1 Tax=Seiridium cardinale TaxID=138064 RepID=A0ABR2XKI9_9PEZI
MFDIYWTDHNRELVGERTVRKEREEREAKAKEGDGKKHENSRHSVSTTSSASSERGFGFFSSKGRKKVATPSRVDYATYQPKSVADSSNERNVSAYGLKRLLVPGDGPELNAKPANGDLLPVQHPHIVDNCSSPSSRESVFSKWTQPSHATSSTVTSNSPRSSVATKSENFVQTLGPSSFIMKTTQVIVAPRNMDCDLDHLVSEIHISSDRTKAATPPLEDLPEEGTPLPFDDSDSALLLVRLPQTPPPVEVRATAGSLTLCSNNADLTGVFEGWRPPHEWDCATARDIPIASLEEKTRSLAVDRDDSHYISPNLSALQREIHMMAAASPELMLANIKAGMGDAADAMVYKELEMTKKRWMFSALHQNEKYAGGLHHSSFQPGFQKLPRPPRVLAIYETHASMTFTAALYPNIKISHLSPSPVSPHLFPNIQPILVPTISASAASRPLPPQLFSSVTCLSMASLFPSTDIPPFLRAVHRCLAAGGAYHLTIIDPEPVSSSMGPKLRQWLIDNLLTNLEQAFRTTLPSRTLPTWLAVSRLRGKGSTIMSLSVPAVPEGFMRIQGVKDPGPVKAELRCTVLRMLWQEVWGNFVHARSWWWEEEEILQECLEHGTYWVYSHVVAVKED